MTKLTTISFLIIGTLAANVQNLSAQNNYVFDSSGAMTLGGVLNQGPSDSLQGLGDGGPRMYWFPRKASFRFGAINTLEMYYSFIGSYSFAGGKESMAEGDYSFAFGELAYSQAPHSIALGSGASTSLYADYSVALGSSSTLGQHSVAVGYNSVSSGTGSIALGYDVEASSTGSFAAGIYTLASGYSSTALGRYTEATSFYSTAFGYDTLASGYASTAFGFRTTASSNYSTAAGRNTIASHSDVFVIGFYNDELVGVAFADRPLFVVGNGTSSIRNNALEVRANGDVHIQRIPPKGGIGMGNFDSN